MKALSLASAIALAAGSTSCMASSVIISEYVEGSSYNKALEFYNPSASSIDLSSYEVQFYFNGSQSPGRTINLSGNIASGDVFVLAHSSADPAITSNANQQSGGSWFNGDDAVVLLSGGAVIDAIGQIGNDPGSQWGADLTSTQDNTLRRMDIITSGDNDAYNGFNPADEWQGFALNTFDGLGSHSTAQTTPPPVEEPPVSGTLVINELDADTSGADTAEFIELYDGGVGLTDLSGYVIVLYNGNKDTVYKTIDLTGFQTNANGYFVLGNSAVSNVNLTFANGTLQNGADAAALYQANAIDFSNGNPVSTNNLVDAIVYGTNDAADNGLLVLLNPAEPQVDEASNGNKDTESNQRCANGSGGLRNTTSYVQAAPTPGAHNACNIVASCGSAATLIHTIQGDTDTSPLEGQLHTIEAIVVGDFQDTTTGLSGFFVQEEAAEHDANATTSEGLFIYDADFGVDVNPGDLVRVSGTVTEYFGLTELNAITDVEVCGTTGLPAATDVNLPFSSLTAAEAFEGMLVRLPQTLTVTETYNLGRYGEFMMSSGGRLFNPTNVVAPGTTANAMQAENDLNHLVIDDGLSVQNPDPVIHPAPGLTAQNTLRSGDTASGISGVLSYSASAYRLHPTSSISFTQANPRPAPLALPATGQIRVSSYNVLNYFNGDGQGGGFPTARGADTAAEFSRQREKILPAIHSMQADIIGLMEIENDGYGSNSAIQDLVNGLNALETGNPYSFINPGVSQIGTDAIAVGFIYRNDKVSPAGSAAILDSSVDSRFDDSKNRPTLAQTFQSLDNNAKLTLAVNHLKSKGSSCASIGDPDTGDGQGNCNLTRTRAAAAMTDWLATDPTGSNDSDVLIIGDLNAYAMEDPVTTIQSAGYSNQLGTTDYTYIFKGQAGNLDHALTSTSLTPQVSLAAIWHINTDEPRALDYNEEFKSANQLLSFYNNDAYRSSDHEPVIIDLLLNP